MRFEDNMMPVLTGLVFAVVLGTTVQNSDDVMKMFGASTEVQADDDVFFVRAGSDTTLDVLANDLIGKAADNAPIQIVSGPSCGEVSPTASGVSYLNSGGCEGPVSFTYCLGEGEACAPADVTMNVRPAPVSVADTKLPGKGDLVPLSVNGINNVPAAAGKTPELSAFVVTIAPQKTDELTRFSSVSRYMIDAHVSDLNKTPSSDPSQFASLRPIDVPLSAVRSAQFLTNYEASVSALDAVDLEKLDVEKPLIEQIEVKGDTAKIDLIAPALVDNTQG